MEAQACKCALVTTKTGGIPEYTVPGKTALVAELPHPAELAEHLVDLLRSRKKLAEIQEAGHQHIKKFTWVESAKKLVQILSEI